MKGTNSKLPEEKWERQIKAVAYVLVWAASTGFFYASVLLGVFGGTVWDKGVYVLAAFLFGTLLSFGIRILPVRQLLSMAGNGECRNNYVQMACYASVCLMTLYYYNSGSEYGHSVATRYMNFAFALALLCLYGRDEVRTKWAALCTAAGLGAMTVPLWSGMEWKEGYLYVLTVFVAWIYAILLFCLLQRIRRRRIRGDFSRIAWLTALFFVLLIVFKNTRTWPFSVVIPFGTLYLHRLDQGGTDRLLKNFAYGVMLAFWLMFGSAILFRPYYSFEFTRYPSWFSSVASAGLFWVLVFGCTVSALLAKLSKGAGIRNFYYEIATLGAVCSHILMSASRTSLLTIAVICTVVFLVTEIVRYRDSVKGMLYKAALIVCPVLLAFPVVYTLTRCVPAIVGRPVRVTGAEWFSDKIEKHEPLDSSKFMNIAQYGEMFLEKILGIDMNLTQITGAVSGPGSKAEMVDGEVVLPDNAVGSYEYDGQIYVIKDYSFSNPNADSGSNGRLDIYKLYLENLNLFGHDTMLVEGTGDLVLFHAHNSYIQAAYDHGIFTGLVFVLLVCGSLVSGFFYYKRNYEEVSFAILPMIVILSFMVAGLTEWIFHPSIPIGFAFLFVLMPLLSKDKQS